VKGSGSSGASSKIGLDLNQRNINEFFNPRESDLPLEERVKLVMSVGEEVIMESEVKELL
jgi:hypothetical protein